ncbi:MAG: HIT family protein [Candidatus Eremiobacteraeota bacterium]|nr:HIT family protein [Candidatus Eremiobacteraeota bacterium]MCW5870545.1 HIT family protein [Candidatus Eremiobacteraeota bacterium]
MSCPFCAPQAWEIFYEGPLVLGLWNAYPVTPGHALLVTRRHLLDWFAASAEEQAELMAAAGPARSCIEAKYRPDGYNLGLNCGEAAGQTVFHLHLHLLPRYQGQRPVSGGETDHLVPAPAHPHLVISNFLEVLREQLESALSFDFCARLALPDLLLIFAWVEGMLKRGGHLRAVLQQPDWEWARRYPGQVELFQATSLPCDYYRIRHVDGRESAWMGGPAWHYTLLGRDGQREVRRAFEGLLTRSDVTPCRIGQASDRNVLGGEG